MKAVLANMGFVMQMSGMFLIIPIIASFVFAETQATIGLFIAAITFLGCGFLFNALCERKDLSFYSSNALIVLSFVFLGIIGSIPYVYINIGGATIVERVTNGLFESVSGFTTTGFTIVPNVDLLPRSILLYRALTQFIGGIGIVLILLVFFYSEEKLVALAQSMGFGSNHRIRRAFFLILSLYVAYDVVVTGVMYLFGFHDVITLTEFVFASISTGGFAPTQFIESLIVQKPFGMMLIVGMMLGASNFMDLSKLFTLRVWSFLKSEVMAFICVLVCAIVAIQYFFHLGWFTTTFHVVSAMTTTGFGYVDVQGFSETLRLVFIALMMTGATSFSTAGGLKMQRIFLLIKVLPKIVYESVTGKERKVTVFGTEYTSTEVLHTLTSAWILILSTLLFAFIVHLHGFPFVDSLFEVTSAITCTGFGGMIAAPTATIALKLLFTLIMLLGRVEIIAVLIFLYAKDEPDTST